MSRRTSRNNSYTSGMNPSGFYKAEVVAVDGDYVSVKVARLGLSNVYENVPFTGFTPVAGDSVWVSFLEGKAAHLLAFVGAGDTSSDITEIVAGTNLNGGGSGGSITLNLDSAITLTTVNANLVGNVTGNVTGDVTGDVTGNVTGNQSGGSISATTLTTSGDATVGGDLTVNGTTVTLNTETLTVEDNVIVLNSNVTGTPSLDAGIEVERGSSSNVSFLWDESADAWSIGAVDFVVDTDTLFVDATNDRVGIGTTTPAQALEVDGQVVIGAGDDITPDGTGNGHLKIDGNTYSSFVTMDGTGTWIGNNSNNRSMILATDETARLTVDGTGNVGIGTNDPVAGLHIEGFGDVSNSSTGHYLQMGATSGANIRIDNNEINAANNGSAGTLYLQNDGGTLSIGNNTATNVGIGRNDPDTLLHVNGAVTISSDTGVGNTHFPFTDGRFYYTADPETGGTGDHVFRHYSGGSYVEQMRILENGNVGINDNSPSYKLDVNGTARFTDQVYVQSILNVTNDLKVDTDTLFVDVSADRVGINDSTPSYALDVNGTARVYNGNMIVGTTSTNYKMYLYRQDTGTADHINIYNGSTLVGTIGAEDDTWLRLNQEVAKNIYTPRLLRADGGFQAGNGSAATPAYSFVGDSNTGFYITGNSGVIYWSGNNNTGGYLFNGGIRTDNGTASTPAYSFTGDTDTGMIRYTTNQIALIAGGVGCLIGAAGTINTAGLETTSTTGYRYVLRNNTYGTLYNFTSSADVKENITNVTASDAAAWIDALQPVTFNERWLQDGTESDEDRAFREADIQVGFIADDVLANSTTAQFAQVEDVDGTLKGVGWKWECVLAAAVAEIKSLRARVAELEAQ